jgi:hypothetical protein
MKIGYFAVPSLVLLLLCGTAQAVLFCSTAQAFEIYALGSSATNYGAAYFGGYAI